DTRKPSPRRRNVTTTSEDGGKGLRKIIVAGGNRNQRYRSEWRYPLVDNGGKADLRIAFKRQQQPNRKRAAARTIDLCGMHSACLHQVAQRYAKPLPAAGVEAQVFDGIAFAGDKHAIDRIALIIGQLKTPDRAGLVNREIRQH